MNKSRTITDKGALPVSTKGPGTMGWCIVAFAGLVVLAGGGASKLLASPYTVSNALRHTGYHKMLVGDLNLHNNGGLMAMTPYGTTFLTNGPGSRGLDFNSDADFINSGAVGRADNYMNLFFGCFNAPVTGTYTFRNAGDDDRCGIWIDLDQDGIFESSTPGLGTNRGEQLSWDEGSLHTVSLNAGAYMFAVTHGETTGNSRVDVRFKIPLGHEVIINPSLPAQDGLWTTVPEPATLTLLALGGLTVLRRRRRRS